MSEGYNAISMRQMIEELTRLNPDEDDFMIFMSEQKEAYEIVSVTQWTNGINPDPQKPAKGICMVFKPTGRKLALEYVQESSEDLH